MDLFPNASDDAIALFCCVGALLVSGTIMFFSRYLNSAAAQAAQAAETPQLRLARPEAHEQHMARQEKAA